MKRQDSSLRSASSRGENGTENLHAKTVGCMSGIAHFLSKYHSSRKFLTFGRKQEKNGAGSSSRISKSSTAIQASTPPMLGQVKNGDKSIYLRRFSCNIPRSPTLPAEIRRSNSVDPPENSPIPPTLIARLMGLEQALAPQVMPKTVVPEPTSTNKRQQLLGALEKCDEDLKALKKIIDAVRAADGLRSPAVVKRMEAIGDKKKRFYGANSKCLEFGTEHPSPVSVLDESTRSPFSNHQHYRKQVLNYGRAQPQQQRKKPGEEDFININPSIIDKITTESVEASSSPLIWNSNAMRESVEEVCRDIAWGERREIGRIGLALQDHICKELIQEMVTEMGYSCVYSLPFEACKRRLRF